MRAISRVGAVRALCAMMVGWTAVRADNFVARTGQPSAWPHTSWVTAASNIQDAVNAATNNATVWVDAGIYTVPPAPTNALGTNVVFINRPLALRAAAANPDDTIIDGGGSNRGVYMALAVPGHVVLDGFTITNCYSYGRGGGVYLYAAVAGTTGVVQNCIITGNNVERFSTYPGGGGLWCVRSSIWPMVSNCTFRGNHSLPGTFTTNRGGAVYIDSQGLVVDCIVENNTAYNGGGVYLTDTTMDRCTVRDNYATFAGGGCYAQAVNVRNSLFYRNQADTQGGGWYSYSGNVFVDNCTFVSNDCPGGGAGGLHLRITAVPSYLRNCIMYANNHVGTRSNYHLEAPASQYVYNSCTAPAGTLNTYGSNNIIIDPQFAGFADLNYRLMPESPCINTGTNLDWMGGALDLDRRKRRDRLSRIADIGCYEYLPRGAVIGLR